MTKQEYIEKYGVDAYMVRLEKQKNYQKQRYANDTEFREAQKIKCNARGKERYKNDETYREKYNDENYREQKKIYQRHRYENFREQCKLYKRKQYVENGCIDLIENYELAKADNFKNWDIHHKLEIHEDYVNTTDDLKLMNLYFYRPAEELIWMKREEHNFIHRMSRNAKK